MNLFFLVHCLLPLCLGQSLQYVASFSGNIDGVVNIWQTDQNLTVFNYTLVRLPSSGVVSLFIHTYGDISDPSGKALGPVFNPFNNSHGCYPDTDRWVGDLGNVTYGSTGIALGSIIRDLIELDGVNSILGRGLAIFPSVDNCNRSMVFPTGRPQQAVIGYAPGSASLAWKSNVADFAFIAKLDAYSDSDVTGTVIFKYFGTQVQVSGRIEELTPQQTYGIYILNDPINTQVWNPFNSTSGIPQENAPRRAGDLGNVQAGPDGVAYFTTFLDLVALEGNDSILGRFFGIFSNPNPGSSQQEPELQGNGVLAFGTIGLASNTSTDFALPATTIKGPFHAHVNLVGTGIRGSMIITQAYVGAPLTFSYSISGLPEGDHAVTIDSFGDISNTSTPFNPTNFSIGCYPSRRRRVGDLGNIAVVNGTVDGAVAGVFYNELASLFDTNSIVGRTISVYAAGNNCSEDVLSGAVIAQGVIGIKNSAPEVPANISPPTILSATLYALPSLEARGIVYFRAVPGFSIEVAARVSGLAPSGSFGLTIHRFGDLSDTEAASSIGEHYNPNGTTHGLPTEAIRHAGDLGNIVAQADGTAYLRRYFDLINVSTIIGRSVAVHANADQGSINEIDGNVGAVFAVGVIGITNLTSIPPLTSDTNVAGPLSAVATLNGLGVTGVVTFYQGQLLEHLNVTYSISGLTPGSHGFQISNWGDVSNSTGNALGDRFNPFNSSIGCFPSVARRVGDLGNIIADESGNAIGTLLIDAVSLQDVNSIIGRGLAVRRDADNCQTENLSPIVAQGVIGIANLAGNAAQNPSVWPANYSVVATIIPTGLDNQTLPRGNVWLSILDQQVRVLAVISGLRPAGLYGFHIHTYGDLTNSASNTGDHYNPWNQTHGLPYDNERHIGDFGNLRAQSDGTAYFLDYFNLVELGGVQSVVGRSIVIHSVPDTGRDQTDMGLIAGFGVLGVGGAGKVPSVIPIGPDSPQAPVNGLWGAISLVKGFNSSISGIVNLTQAFAGAPVYVQFNLRFPNPQNLSAANYTLKISQYGDLSSNDGSSAGDVWSLGGTPGCYPTSARRAGDLGQITAFIDVNTSTLWAYGSLIAEQVSLFGATSVVGRSIVVLDGGDSCNGTTGPALAQGVIAIQNSPSLNSYNSLNVPVAISVLQGVGAWTNVSGTVWFQPQGQQVQVMANIKGLTPGSHGFHVKTFGDTRDVLSGSLGDDYNVNPAGYHGLPWDRNRHDGDLGNVVTQSDGNVYFNSYFPLKLGGVTSIVGRSIVVYSRADLGRVNTTDPEGGAGTIIAVGVIGISGAVFPSILQGPDNIKGPFFGVVKIRPVSATMPNLSGNITFAQEADTGLTVITYNLVGLPPGGHAFAIHRYADFNAFPANIGDHLPQEAPTLVSSHGCYPEVHRHAGDVAANITAGPNGNAAGVLIRDLVWLYGVNSIIGRSVILYTNADNCEGSGSSVGSPIGYGIVGIANPATLGRTTDVNQAFHPGINPPVRYGNRTLTAQIFGVPGYEAVRGVVWIQPYFVYTTQIYVNVSGFFKKSTHAVHIQMYGDVLDVFGKNTGAHYDPQPNTTHGLPSEYIHHMGDLGNGVTDNKGVLTWNRAFSMISLTGNQNIVGRTIVIRAIDDKGSKRKPDGGAGDIIAMGVLGYTATNYPFGDPEIIQMYPERSEVGLAFGILLPLFFIAGLGILGYWCSKRDQFKPELVELDERKDDSDNEPTEKPERTRRSKKDKRKQDYDESDSP